MSAEKPPRRVFGQDFDLSVLVVTASDGSAAGRRDDVSGERVAARLAGLGFVVERRVVPDDQPLLEAAIIDGATRHRLVVTTGGTGLTPRDVTPQATLAVVDYQVPGLAEAMRAETRAALPTAVLARQVAGVRDRTLIVTLPGSPRGAVECLEVIAPVLPHAVASLRGEVLHPASGETA
jgi:molybdopterin adenylyltransferase